MEQVRLSQGGKRVSGASKNLGLIRNWAVAALTTNSRNTDCYRTRWLVINNNDDDDMFVLPLQSPLTFAFSLGLTTNVASESRRDSDTYLFIRSATPIIRLLVHSAVNGSQMHSVSVGVVGLPNVRWIRD
jgi:hypothetical protein